MAVTAIHPPIVQAAAVPALAHAEAKTQMEEEVRRTLALLALLSDDDLERPTACPRWTVRAMAGHMAGSLAGYASWGQFWRQYLDPFAAWPYRRRGYSILDTINQIQVDERADRPLRAIGDELERVAPRAIATRQALPAWLRALVLPIPALGTQRVDYLTNEMYPRDLWMHRLDIHRATGRAMVMDGTHDGRILALIVRDLDRRMRHGLGGRAFHLQLAGVAGGHWLIGSGGNPMATLSMTVEDFALRASERLAAADATERCTIDGDVDFARSVLERIVVPF